MRAVGWSSFPNFVGEHHDIRSDKFPIVRAWPTASAVAPADVPEVVSRYYEQGFKSLLGGNWDAAGSMFRKTLDVGTKLLRPDLNQRSLFDRINQMVTDHDLTPAMGEWSHRVRLDGNSAVHDEEPETEADAKNTRDFTEAFLTYAFTLPAKIAAHTNKAANDSVAA